MAEDLIVCLGHAELKLEFCCELFSFASLLAASDSGVRGEMLYLLAPESRSRCLVMFGLAPLHFRCAVSLFESVDFLLPDHHLLAFACFQVSLCMYL